MDFRPCCSGQPPVGALPDVCSAAAAITRVGDVGFSPAASCGPRHACKAPLSAYPANRMDWETPEPLTRTASERSHC